MRIRPSVRLNVLPPALCWLDRFRLAAACGYESVEAQAEQVERHVDAVRDAAGRSGIPVHSVHCRANWLHPLSSGDPQRRAAGIPVPLRSLPGAATARAMAQKLLARRLLGRALGGFRRHFG